MMTIEKANEYLKSVNKWKSLSHLKIFENKRLSSTWGRCCYSRNGVPEKLELSVKLLRGAKEEDIKQVVLHELAHALVWVNYGNKRTKPHGVEFKEACAILGCTHTGATNAINLDNSKLNDYKYELYCPKCNESIRQYKTKCKTIQYASDYSCGRCKTTLIGRAI